jgi:hypothetical protein
MKPLAPENPKDRFDIYRFFNGLSSQGKEGLDQRHNRVPMVKSFLLEHVSPHNSICHKSPRDIFIGFGAQTQMLDESFIELKFPVEDPKTKKKSWVTTGYVEPYDERFMVYYTAEHSVDAQRRVNRWVQQPDLDSTWFSSPLLQKLWEKDVSLRGDERFTRLAFTHESIFDMPEDFAESLECTDDENGDINEEAQEDKIEFERRKSRFEMRDRIKKIRESLQSLQSNYAPLHALSALRFPSRSGHGSHDLYQNGQITNRTDNFEGHRNMVRYLYRIYKSVLDLTEQRAWQTVPQTSLQLRNEPTFKGVPLIINFFEPLSEATFERWVSLAFQRRNRFKLWGNPIRLGPTKVHLYGADRHLWQPINLELTSNGLVAILPHGTCGNTFHRLVTNVQQYISPRIDAWIGAEKFDTLLGDPSTFMEDTNAA